MKPKTARRWISRNQWKLARAEDLGITKGGLQRQFVRCLRALKYKI